MLSVSDSYVRQLQSKGSKAGDVLFELRKEIDRPLAAILTLNTVAHTVGAAGVGAQVMKLFGNEYVAVASGVLTFIILIFTEIIPKTIGAVYWKSMAPTVGFATKQLIWFLYPFVALSELIADLVSSGKKQGPILTREELIASAEISQEEGSIKRKERNIIRNLLKLNNIFVRDVMTPRSVLVALPKTLTVDQAVEKYGPIPFSRIPIYEHGLDDIQGMVLRYELLERYGKDEGPNVRLAEISHPVHRMPDDKSVAFALDEFIKRKEHLFLTTNKDGETSGIVTLEDTVETLLGVEIVDEYDSVEDMRQFALEQWKKRIRGRRTARSVKHLIQDMNQDLNEKSQEQNAARDEKDASKN